MKLYRIDLKSFKNIAESSIEFKNNFSAIYGPNGTGKTAIIESLKLLSLLIRTNGNPKDFLNKIIRRNENTMELEYFFKNKNNEKFSIFYKFQKRGNNIYLNQEIIKFQKSSRSTWKKIIELEQSETTFIEIYINNKKYSNGDNYIINTKKVQEINFNLQSALYNISKLFEKTMLF